MVARDLSILEFSPGAIVHDALDGFPWKFDNKKFSITVKGRSVEISMRHSNA